MLSANGTVFTTEFEGVIPGILKNVGMQNVKNYKQKCVKQLMQAMKQK